MANIMSKMLSISSRPQFWVPDDIKWIASLCETYLTPKPPFQGETIEAVTVEKCPAIVNLSNGSSSVCGRRSKANCIHK